MIFITGGAAQGKRTFAAERLGIKEFTDGGTAPLDELMRAECVTDFQLAVKRLTEEGADPLAFTEKICTEGKTRVIIMNEIGCGIVPIDRAERFWRENVGRCGCIIAANAETVIRMVCGIPTAIKGELP